MQPNSPPALSMNPQFTAQYWDRVPREMRKLKVVRVTKKDDEFNEYVFDDGSAFQRRWSEVDISMFHLLHANLEVFVESIAGANGAAVVTGLFIPTKGWVFRMTGDQLAAYARSLTTALNQQRTQAREELTGFLAKAITDSIGKLCEVTMVGDMLDVKGPLDSKQLASDLIDALDSVGRK